MYTLLVCLALAGVDSSSFSLVSTEIVLENTEYDPYSAAMLKSEEDGTSLIVCKSKNKKWEEFANKKRYRFVLLKPDDDRFEQDVTFIEINDKVGYIKNLPPLEEIKVNLYNVEYCPTCVRGRR